jgi:hypothetical protein
MPFGIPVPKCRSAEQASISNYPPPPPPPPPSYALASMTTSHKTTVLFPSGLINTRARPLVNGTPEFSIFDFPKWVISRHVASLNRTVQIYFETSTMECPDLLSSGLPKSRNPNPDTDSSFGTFAPIHEGLTLMYLLTDPTAVGFSN